MTWTWLKVYVTAPRHPKLLDLAERLDVDEPMALGLVVAVWCFCAEYAPDGDLSRYSARQIARAANFRGEPSALLDALVGAGLVDRDDRESRTHDWDQHFGALAERRENDRLRKRAARAGHPPDPEPLSGGHPPERRRTVVGSRHTVRRRAAKRRAAKSSKA